MYIMVPNLINSLVKCIRELECMKPVSSMCKRMVVLNYVLSSAWSLCSLPESILLYSSCDIAIMGHEPYDQRCITCYKMLYIYGYDYF